MNYRFFQRPSLVFSISALTLLTLMEVPVFIVAFCAILWIWKWLSEMNVVPTLSRRTTTGLSIAVFALIFFQYRTLLEQEASSALLVALTAIKVMDYQTRRDHLMVILLGFLLLTLKPLYGLDLYWLPVQLACMAALWMALSQDPRKIPRPLIGWIFMSAVPIALLLFLIFPRIVLPWAMSRASHKAQMGFTSELNPGQVAELAASNDLVMRVRFLSDLPVDPKEMYWKGARLTVSEGLSWKGPEEASKEKLDETRQPPDIEYELILEPGNGRAIFALDPTYRLISNDAPALQFAPTLWRQPLISSKSQRFYGIARAVFAPTHSPTEGDLQVPALPPKTAEWVRKTKAQFPEARDRLAALRNLFANNEFVYTLNPGLYETKSMDEFLFSKRRGFCEHFAGAYATLARSLGIPARVISGYQGAEYNPLGKFWRVTQRQAHAWVEVWNGSAWERKDPTLWVPISEHNRLEKISFFELIDNANDIYESLNYRWTTFLLDFDQQSQIKILRELLPKIFLIGILILSGFFLLRLIWGWFFTPGNKTRNIRHQHLIQLVQQIKEAEEEYQNQDLSHWPPLKILKSAQNHLYGSPEFYSRLMELYDRTVYRMDMDESELKTELKSLQKKWVEIQLRQK